MSGCESDWKGPCLGPAEADRSMFPGRPMGVLLGMVLTAAGWGADDPRRIASINLCTDALLVRVAQRERIVSISYLAADPAVSPVADAVAGIPTNRGSAEEVLAVHPDLILAGRYTTRSTVALLRRRGLRVVELDPAESIADVRDRIRQVGSLVGEPARAEALTRRLNARLEALEPCPDTPRAVTAIIYRANGLTVGPDTLEGDVLGFAGLENLAERLGVKSWGTLALEELILLKPDFLVRGAHGEEPYSMARRNLEHPVLRRSRLGALSVTIPDSLWSCAGPWVADAVARLAEVCEAGAVAP